MTSLAPNADSAVRHAVDAYIDGRLLPTFEGEAFFETRNSRYRLMDGVLFQAPESALVGAELVGWLVDYVSRSEVVTRWRAGARAVLVDTRNDGVRGPQIVVTSATRAFHSERDARQSSPRDARQSSPRDAFQSAPRDTFQSAPRDTFQSAPRAAAPSVPAPPPMAAAPPLASPPLGGSRMPQSGSTLPPPPPPEAAFRAPRTLPPPPPLPVYRPASVPPPATVGAPPPAMYLPAPLPPPAMVARPPAIAPAPPPPAPRPLPRALPPPAFADEVAARKIAAIEAAWIPSDDTEDASPTIRNEDSRGTSRLAHGRGVSQRLPPPPASVPFLLSRPHTRQSLPRDVRQSGPRDVRQSSAHLPARPASPMTSPLT
jgi:hypothetical protein